MTDLATRIEDLWDQRDSLDPADADVPATIAEAIDLLDCGAALVAEIDGSGEVVVHEWPSGGVGIGGVPEPAQASPVIIEDECFIGSRAMITEGSRVGEGAVIGSGLILNGSVLVIDAETGDEISRGHVPPWSVTVFATRPKNFAGGSFGLPCALVLKRLAAGERHDKGALNDILRTHGVAL